MKARVFEYMRHQAALLKKSDRERTGETYMQALASFRKFRKGKDLAFSEIDDPMIRCYEGCHSSRSHISKNQTFPESS